MKLHTLWTSPGKLLFFDWLSSCGAGCFLHTKFWSLGAGLVDMKMPPGKEELHPDRVPETKPTPGAHAVDTDD